MAKTALLEIKKGQLGTGLLIEHDGYMSLDSSENKVLKESINEALKFGKELPNPFVVSAVFQKYGIENANGRIYPEHVLKRESEKYQQAINERRSYGELNHPVESAIDLGRICLLITELHWVGHTLVGTMEIPITDGFRKMGIVSTCADTLAQWLISGLKVGVSSRGVGTVSQQGNHVVVNDDYDIICWDAVSQPSTNSAWIEPSEKDLQPYIQEQKTNNEEVIKEDKFSKFDKWLLNG